MIQVKICGLTREDDILQVNSLNPDIIGFVFAKSRRRVTKDQAQHLKSMLKPSIRSAGVFTDAPISLIKELVQENIIDIVQLHGNETADYIEEIKSILSCPIIKAIRVDSMETILKAQKLRCDYLLLDTYIPGEMGGSGITFNWNIIPPEIKPYFLAGGLDSSNVKSALSNCRPYGIDVSSGVETNGLKDPDKISAFIKAAKGEN